MSEPGSLIRSLSGRQSARNFHSYVISEIGVGIASGRFPVGSILPNDAEMMGAYDVSRTVLREALKTLEAKGMVEARAKVGTRVLPRSRWNLFDRQVLTWVQEAGPDPGFIASFIEVRETIELQVTTLAVQRRSAEQLRMLVYWQHQREVAATLPEPFAMAEFEFHRTLYDATQNPFLRVASALAEFAVAQVTVARMRAGVTDFAAEKAPRYASLVAAVATGDASMAATDMRAILGNDHRWLSG
jgi:DNA-binding FadR family transcriptional regulator